MKKLLFSASLVLALTASPRAESGSTSEPATPASVGETVVARGKGFEIRRKAIDQVLATAMVKNPHDELPPDSELRALAQLIEIQLVLGKASAEEKAEGQRKIDEKLAEIAKNWSPAEFAGRLKATQMTADDLRVMLFQEETAQASLTRQLGVEVTDADVKQYFEENPGIFDQPAKAHLRELLLLTTVGYSSDPLPDSRIQLKHQQIKELRERVRAGEDFAALARQFNEDPLTREAGGEYSFTVDQLDKTLADLALAMKPGQISEVVSNDDGYLFFQLIEIIPARKAEFSAVAEKLKKTLIGEQKKMLATGYLEGLRAEAEVEILDGKLREGMARANAEAAKARAAATNPPPAAP